MIYKSIAFLLLIVPFSQAQQYCAPAIKHNAYVAPVAVKQKVVGYDYQQKVIAVPVELNRDYYASGQDYYRDSLLADAIVGKLLQMQKLQQQQVSPEQYQQFLQLLQQMQGQQPGHNPFAPQQPLIEGVKTDGSQLQQYLAQSIKKDCLMCHSSGTKKGGLDLSDLSNVDRRTRVLMSAMVEFGEMPQGMPKLSEQWQEVYKQYVEQGK